MNRRAALHRAATAAGLICVGLVCAGLAHAQTGKRLSTSPYFVLGVSLEDLPIDAIGACLGRREPIEAAKETQLEPEVAAAAPDAIPADPNDVLETAIRRARSAREHDRLELAWKALSRAIPDATTPRTIACGWLEKARLEMRIGRVPEARVTATRASEAFAEGEVPDSIRRAIDFFRAESLARSADPDAAQTLYTQLSTGSDAVARAARVRLADRQWVDAPSSEHLRELEKRVTESELASSAIWAPRLAEAAILAGDDDAAGRWLAVAADPTLPRSVEVEAALLVRRADLLYRGGSRKDKEHAQKILQELAETGRTDTIRRLALVRAIDLGNRSRESALVRLERTMRLGDRRVAAYAAEILARRLASTERFAEALDVAVEWVHRRADIPGEQVDAKVFDQILTGLTASGPCETWIEHIGGRRDLLLRSASDAEPFLTLGDCYFQVGMSTAALETYRGIAKAFGPAAVTAVTLRSARAEFELGRLATARAATRANVRKGVEPREAWLLLDARIRLADGSPAEALDSLRPMLERIANSPAPTYATDEATAILMSAQAIANAPTESDRALLERSLKRPFRDHMDEGLLTEAALIAADLNREAGRISAARVLYNRVLGIVPPGIMHSRAAYWLGVLARHPDEARAMWSKVSADDDPWARLARNEISLSEGRASVGHPLAVPIPRAPAALSSRGASP